MASVSRQSVLRGTAPNYLPTPAEIAEHTGNFKLRKLETLANLPDPAETERQIAREKLRKNRKAEIEAAAAKIEANRFNVPDDYQPKVRVPVPAGGPREMTKADIANVERLQFGDLDPAFDMLIDAATAQHETEDLLCRWNVADVDHDLMDLSDAPPFKAEKPFKPTGAFGVVG